MAQKYVLPKRATAPFWDDKKKALPNVKCKLRMRSNIQEYIAELFKAKTVGLGVFFSVKKFANRSSLRKAKYLTKCLL